MSPREPARDKARWHTPRSVWLDHATVTDDDLEWLAPAVRVTFWSVKVPAGFFAALPDLAHLDLRGGSGESLDDVRGCARLRSLEVRHVRGLHDLAVVPTLTALELLDLYGLLKVTALPSLAPLTSLVRVGLGSLRGLSGLTGLHDAPALEELNLINKVGVADDDAERLARHPALRRFEWFADGVPVRVWKPFVETVGKPKPRPMLSEDWFAERDR